jgi:hypothetical protein
MASTRQAQARPARRGGRRTRKPAVETAPALAAATPLAAALAEDFARHGSKVIARVRLDRPVDYLRLVAAVLPKEAPIPDPLEGLTDAELAAAAVQLRDWLADVAEARSAPGGAPADKPARDVQTLPQAGDLS